MLVVYDDKLLYTLQIYSNSWGPSDNGYTLEGPGQLLQKTFEEAARTV